MKPIPGRAPGYGDGFYATVGALHAGLAGVQITGILKEIQMPPLAGFRCHARDSRAGRTGDRPTVSREGNRV